MTDKEKSWQAYCESIMPTRRDYIYPLQGAFYKAFCAGYDAAQCKERIDRREGMTTLREAAQQALEALEGVISAHGYQGGTPVEVTTALRQAIEQAEQAQPVAWRWLNNGKPEGEKCFQMPGPDEDIVAQAVTCEFPRTVQYLYTVPPPRHPLTDEEIKSLVEKCGIDVRFIPHTSALIARAIEAAHGIKGEE